MPGCSVGAQLASMTGSTDLGPIQPQQDSTPLLDDSLFADDRRGYSSTRLPARRKMTPPTGTGAPIQLTPLWEYVVRTKKFPPDVDVAMIFDEISQRLRDPEWEVRQHALRVLVDVLCTFPPNEVDKVAALVLLDLVDNLGNPAPAVRKGSLDALRIYLLHTPHRDEITAKIIHDGMNRPDVLDDYQTSIATGVILSTPLLLFPSKSSTRPGGEVIREATQALAMRLVQVTHQESALRSLAKIRDAIGDEEFAAYLQEVDGSMKRNFDLLCDVYEIKRSSPTAKRKRPESRGKQQSLDKSRRKDSIEDSNKNFMAMDKSWESEEDSDTSGIAEEDEEGSAASRSGSSGGITSARVVLETEIKFNEETAITMTILEEQEKAKGECSEEENEDEDVEEDEGQEADGEIGPTDEDNLMEKRKTPRRVHFGGEIVKLRTPDSEDTESILSDVHMQPQQIPRTRIPLPVSPATRLPPQQPRRVRSSSQPNGSRGRNRHRQKRSASSSPRRDFYVHDGNLSPKKSILSKCSDFGDRQTRFHRSRRDSLHSPLTSPRIVIQEIDSAEEPSFRVCEEPQLAVSSQREENAFAGKPRPISPSASILGDVVDSNRVRDNIDSIFGDRSGIEFQEKLQKDQENMMRSVYRSKSALEKVTKFDWMGEEIANTSEQERPRTSSAKSASFEAFPRQERNYILMELSSPTKDTSRRASLEDNPMDEVSKTTEQTDLKKEQPEDPPKSESEQVTEAKNNAEEVDSNKTEESDKVEESKIKEKDTEPHLGMIADDIEKSALDAKERSSDSSSDGEWKSKEPNWEELGLVDEEILNDFHNKEDWRARVRGLERIASAFRAPPTLEAVEPRLGSLLHAVLGGERSCRVAAAGLSVARVVLTGVSEDALKDRLSLIAWGLARQGGPNAAHLARLVMLRTSPGLFVEKLLQPQNIGARNAKMRENTLQLFIFSLVTFPSTEFKVKSAIDKVVAMVDDRRKRVRYAALDTLAVMSQIYDSEDILEASKRFTKGKQDGQTIQTAIKTRLSRKLLPSVSVDGLVVYGLQISSNSPHTGADVEWIEAGSGSVSPGTGRTRSQLIATSRIEEEQSNMKKIRSRPVSEHSILGSSSLLEKNERTSSWKLLPQSDLNDKQNQDIKSKTIGRTSKSADISKVSTLEFDYHREEAEERVIKNYQPYATPKRSERNSNKDSKADTEDYSTPPPRQESRIPIYTGDRSTKATAAEMNSGSRERSPADAPVRRDKRNSDYNDYNGYMSIHQRRKLQTVKNTLHRTNALENNYGYDKFVEDTNGLQAKFREDRRHSPLHDFKENEQRASGYEKLNKNFNTVIKNSRAGLSSEPHCQYSSKITETYESIYQRQQRSREEKASRSNATPLNSLSYGYEYEGYRNKKMQIENDNNSMEPKTEQQSPYRKRMFVSPFDDRTNEKTMGALDKDANQETDSSSAAELNYRVGSSKTLSKSAGSLLLGSPRHEVGEARSNSGSSSSSNRSSGVRRLRVSSSNSRHQTATSLPVQSESDELNVCRSEDKAFDVISTKSNPTRRNTPDAASFHTEIEEDQRTTSGSEEHPLTIPNHTETSSSASVDSADGIDNTKHRSADSLISHRRLSVAETEDEAPKGNDLLPAKCNGYAAVGDRLSAARGNIREATSRSTSPARSMVGINGNERETSEYPEEEKAFETLDFRNAAREAASGTSIVVTSPVRSREPYDYDNKLLNTNSNMPLYHCTSRSPKNASPKRFISEDPPSKDSDDSSETPPLPIGFDTISRAPTESSDAGTDETDDGDVSVKPQPSRLPTPIDLPRRLCKLSPCKMRPQGTCYRATSVAAVRHPEKMSKQVQLCFTQLESKDWEVTLKGLRLLSQVARDEPEQLDACAPGLLARLLGKHVKNLRSQVARVACSAAGEVFAAHVRGIDQDLDEIAGALLHRTADTNRFLREDCNVALDSMIEHFPPTRTIMTIANRGASHQNTIVHATTARLLYAIVNEIGLENSMNLPREVKDKLFATTAKLLTDGNLQARKHAKETFRLLSRCDGFRKSLTDAVPESTLRLIDKTLRSL